MDKLASRFVFHASGILKLRKMPSNELISRVIGSRGLSVPFCIVALLGLVGAWRLWSLIDTAGMAQPDVTTRMPVSSGKPGGVDIAAIQRTHLFGVSAADTTDAPAPRNMVLVGVFASQDPEHGYAMLGATPGSIGVFQPGAEVVPGTWLKSVYRDYVLLERAGIVSRLQMSALQAGLVAASLHAEAPKPGEPGPALPVGTSEQVQPEDVLQVQVARLNGKVQGYRVRPGAEPEAFSRSGLQTGDVVVAVNGQRDDLLRVLRSDRSARVTILRNGAQQDLTLNLDGPT